MADGGSEDAVASKDLSLVARPVSDFLSLSGDVWPVTDAMVAKYALSAEDLARYERDGFLEDLAVLSEEQVARLQEELADLMREDHPLRSLWYEFHMNELETAGGGSEAGVLFHSLGAWRISPGFHDLLFHPGVLVRARQLFGGAAVRFWHDQLFCKPPKTGAGVAWHQDYSYWTRTVPMQHLTLHIALDAQTAENGALRYIPGSHKWPLLPVTAQHFEDMESVRKVLSAEQARQFEEGKVTTRLAAGTMAIHHPLTLHGSEANTSPHHRRATVVNLFADGTKAAAKGTPLLEGIPPIPDGEPLRGRFFPLLAETSGGEGVGGGEVGEEGREGREG